MKFKKEINIVPHIVTDFKQKIFDEIFLETRPSLTDIANKLEREEIIFFSKSNITSLLLLLALSIHAFFEGIAIGLLDSNRELIFMFIAISFHKWVEALSIVIIIK